MDDFTKVPPQNAEAERSLLGAMMIEGDAISTALDIVTKDDFYDNNNGVIFTAIKNLHLKNAPVDMVTVSDLLKKEGTFDSVGGATYLVDTIDTVSTAVNIDYYCKIVKEKSILRNNIKLASNIIQQCYSGLDHQEIFNGVQKEYESIFSIDEKTEHNLVMATSDDFLREYQDVLDKRHEMFKDGPEFPSGFRDLDKLLQVGFLRGQIATIGARPSVGKTALCINLISNFLKKKKRTLIFTTEMTRHNVFDRVLSMNYGVNGYDLLMGRVDKKVSDAINSFREDFFEREFFICDIPEPTSRDIEDIIVKVKPDVFIFDYFNRAITANMDKRAIELEMIINKMQTLALRYNCAGIVAAQLNREYEKSKSAEPLMSHLKDTGGLEQVSSLIICLARLAPETSDEADEMFAKGTEKIKLWILKNRFGEIGTVELNFNGSRLRFEDLPEKHF